MNIESKLKLIDKSLEKKEGIMLDHFYFYEQEDKDSDFIFDIWKNYINDTSTKKDIKFYLHIPFCNKICKYCMYSTIKLDKQDEIDLYIYNLKNYLQKYISLFKDIKFKGIYIGGGTPSILSLDQINNLFSFIFNNFSFDDDYYKTIEMNPSSTNFLKLKLLKDLGFDRISFGVQSFDKSTLEIENRTYVSKDRIKDLVDYCKKVGFLDINLDIILGLNKEDSIKIVNNVLNVAYIKPYSVTLYTILKDRGNSILYDGDEGKFYDNVTYIQDLILSNDLINNNFDYSERDNLLSLGLFLKGRPKHKKNYEAHSIKMESLFGVGYNSYSKIWGLGSYQFTNFSNNGNVNHRFVKSDFKTEIFFYVLKSFQYIINKIEFKDIFGIEISDLFSKEFLYLEKNNIIKQDEYTITYIGKKELIGYYGLTLLDLKYLVYILKNNFHNKNNVSLVKG